MRIYRRSREERLSARSARGFNATAARSGTVSPREAIPIGSEDDQQAVVVEVTGGDGVGDGVGSGGTNPFGKFSLDGTDGPTAAAARANAHVIIAESDEDEELHQRNSDEVVMGTQDSEQKLPEGESDYEPDSDKEDEDVSEGGSDYEGSESESSSGSESEGLW